MIKTALKVLWIFLFFGVSIATICSRNPLCYCSTNTYKNMKIFCKNVTNITPIQNLLEKYISVYSLRIVAPELNSLPSKVFSGRLITVLEIDAPLVYVPDDALADIFGLVIVNFMGGHFSNISNTFSSEEFKTVQLVHGQLDNIGNQLQNNSKMTDALFYDNQIGHISSEAFLNARSLEYLNLSRNLLSSLDPSMFSHISQLKSIDLSNNRLFTVDGYFDSMNPQVLKLYGNNLTNIDNAFRHNMWYTKVFDLGGNPFLNLTSSTFDGKMKYLKILSLNDNKFDYLDPYLLWHFRYLSKLGLNGNHLSTLPKQFLMSTPNLTTLELNGNNFASVEDIFPVDDQNYFVIHSLKTVKINSNRLGSIRFGSSAKSILYLDLGSNLISYVLENDLSNLTSVIHLNLSGNPLSEVEAGCFQRLVKRRSLDLSSTNLKQLNRSVQHLGELKELSVDSSSLTFLDNNEFLGLNNLQTISLKNNSLLSVYPVMQNLTNLTTLDVSSNNLTTLTLSSLPTNEKKVVKLKKLWIAGNPLSCDCRLSWILDWLKIKGSILEDKPICQSPPTLQGRTIRSLNSSELEFWHEDCPYFCVCICKTEGENLFTTVDCTNRNLDAIPEHFPFNIKEIDLENNSITSFSGFYTKNWPHLEIINAENNNLYEVSLELSPSMKELKLAVNNLTRFPPRDWNISSLQLLTLSKNPWICDCQAWEFRQWLIKYQHSVSDIQEVRCNLPGKLTNRIIIQLQRDEMCPNSKITKISVIAGIAALVVVLVILCCISRKALAALFYSCGCRCLKANEKHDYNFDAFLLYADEDEDFALNIIAEGLESRNPEIKLFVPTRQIFLTNSPINIESSLADCCKVIVLLTKEFLRNSQCMQLLKSSMACSIQHSSRRMIFVLLGKGNILKDVDPTLKAIINNSVCLRCGEILFWPKLKYSLPQKTETRLVDEQNNSLISNEVYN